MDTSATHPRRRRRTVLAVAACAFLGLAAAVLGLYSVSLQPPGLKARDLGEAGASTRVLLDPERSAITNRHTVTTDFESLSKRGSLLGQLMASMPVREHIARRAGLPVDDISAVARITANVPSTLIEPDSEQRADEIRQSRKPYRLDIQPRPSVPVIDVYAQAPTPAEAERLADGAVAGLGDYIRAIADEQGTDPAAGVLLHQLGPARGTVINGSARLIIGGLTFLLVFTTAGGLYLAATRARRGWKAQAATEEPDAAPAGGGRGAAGARVPAGVFAMSPGGEAVLRPGMPSWSFAGPRLHQLRDAVSYAGDWPRTTRVLPWMIAAFIAMLWLVPFNQIALAASLPIDL
jgi:hypothetical protein